MGLINKLGQALDLWTRWDYEPTQDLFNLTLNGSFDLFNQTHDRFRYHLRQSKNKRPTYSVGV
jgi:outer membrane receptor for ferric coprogen and ferric-rhodotorulic acid